MALLVFLAAAAPAGVVAAGAVVLVHVAGLHVRQELGRLLLARDVFGAARCGGGRDRARLGGGRAARVGEIASGTGVGAGAPRLRLLRRAARSRGALAVLALDLHLDAE